jgi:hypothetical protein
MGKRDAEVEFRKSTFRKSTFRSLGQDILNDACVFDASQAKI